MTTTSPSTSQVEAPPTSTIGPVSEFGRATLYERPSRSAEEAVTAFAWEFLQRDDAVVSPVGESDGSKWRISGAELDLEVTTRWFPALDVEHPAVWGITHVDNLTDDDTWYLTVAVSEIDDGWGARIAFPPPEASAMARLASADWEAGGVWVDGEVVLDLPAMPTAPISLLVFHYDHTLVTSVHGIILAPAELLTD